MSLGQIRVSDVIDDVRGGMTDSNMMDKYKLSSNGLARLFRKLLDHKALSSFDFVQWSALFCESPEVKNIRLFPRNDLKFRLPIYEAGHSEMRGEILNVSDGGLAVIGLEAQVHETRTFVIPIKKAPVLFKARCQWIRPEPVRGASVVGFDVVSVMKGDWQKFLELIQAESLRREKVTRAEVSPTNSDTEAPKSEMAIGESCTSKSRARKQN